MYRPPTTRSQPQGRVPVRDEAMDRLHMPFHHQFQQQQQQQQQQQPHPHLLGLGLGFHQPEDDVHHHQRQQHQEEEADPRLAEQGFFGVDPLQVMEDVINAVETYLCEGLDSLEADALATSGPLLKKADPKLHQRLVDQIREAVDNICNTLQPSVAEHMDGFEEHILGLILRIPDGLVVPGSQHAVFSPHKSALPHSELFLQQHHPTPAYPPPSHPNHLYPQAAPRGLVIPEAPEVLSEELLQQQEAQLDSELAELAQQLRVARHQQRLMQAEQAQLQAIMGDIESNELARLLREKDPVDTNTLETVISHIRRAMQDTAYLQSVAPPADFSSSSAAARKSQAATGRQDNPPADQDLFYNFEDSPPGDPSSMEESLGIQDLLNFAPPPP